MGEWPIYLRECSYILLEPTKNSSLRLRGCMRIGICIGSNWMVFLWTHQSTVPMFMLDHSLATGLICAMRPSFGGFKQGLIIQTKHCLNWHCVLEMNSLPQTMPSCTWLCSFDPLQHLVATKLASHMKARWCKCLEWWIPKLIINALNGCMHYTTLISRGAGSSW
jgi:hypothetical protein